MKKLLIFISMILSITTMIGAQTLELHISNVKTLEGHISIGIFDSEESFRDEEPIILHSYKKTSLDPITVAIDVAPGEYAVVVLDDLNMDNQMSYNKLGIPKEGFHIVGYKVNMFRKPRFERLKFSISEGEIQKYDIELKYYL